MEFWSVSVDLVSMDENLKWDQKKSRISSNLKEKLTDNW